MKTPSLPLDRWAQLNVEMDHLAKEYLFAIQQDRGGLRQHCINEEGLSMWMENQKVSSKLWETLYVHIQKPCTLAKWEKQGIPKADGDQLDWNANENAL